MRFFKALFIILLISINCFSQTLYKNTLDKENKNAIYANIGFVPVWGVINAAYERRLLKTNSAFINSLWAKVGGGYWVEFSSGGPHAMAGITALSGTGNHHIEASVGFVSLYNYADYKKDLQSYEIVGNVKPSRGDYLNHHPAGGLGYRYQNPETGFIVRTGISFPEAIYVGVGFCF
ncbi:hypothetical protein GCM10011506_35430 [Marivirga lumbricoides]|uniref:DUF3575 domain-containing protein n=1 Tax=Marivirga lumbricoides TaxID=1046115 RepID=A0ABQ1MTJ0_9BACT|nr:hypothetical protein GCM10011506_35430 [Marivirga lumbricoides]